MDDTAVIDTETRTLRVDRVFRATRERVYAAFTDPALLAQWWGPEGVHAPDVRMEVREGGAWRTVMRNSEGTDFIVSGVYVQLQPTSRIVFTWGWEEDGARGHESLVEIELQDHPDGTSLSLTHAIFESAESRDNHGQGWASSLDCLAAVL